jgi:hypothetical protein
MRGMQAAIEIVAAERTIDIPDLVTKSGDDKLPPEATSVGFAPAAEKSTGKCSSLFVKGALFLERTKLLRLTRSFASVVWGHSLK